MLSRETESRVVQLLWTWGQKEKAVELNRQVLAQNVEFDAYQVFSILDREGKNNIDPVNFVDFLRRNGIYSTLTEMQFLILFYDENCDNQLSYTEFLDLILPESNFSLRRMTRESAGQTQTKQPLPFNVEYAVIKVLEKELDLVRSVTIGLDNLKLRYDFNIHHIFHLISNYGFITPESIRRFLNRNSVIVNEDEVRGIMKRLDLNHDSKVDLNNLHSLLSFPCCSIQKGNNQIPCNRCKQDCCCCGDYNMEEVNRSISPNSNLRLRSSPVRMGNNCSNNDLSKSFNNSQQMMEGNNSWKVKQVSPNLSLRLSPQRRFSPRNSPRCSPRTSPMRQNNNFQPLSSNNMNMSQRSLSPLRSSSPPRRFSPHHHHSPHCSPHHCYPRHSSPPRCPCCSKCQCSPCRCCLWSFEQGEACLLNYMKEVMNVENQIEKAKIEWALRTDFNIEDAYRIFELDGRGIITEADWKYGLTWLDIHASSNDIKLIMKRADLKRTGTINYADFFDWLTPFEKDYRNMVENRLPSTFTPSYNKSDVFLTSTKVYLQNLIRLIINLENRLENMKISLDPARGEIRNIYNELDRCGLGVISEMDFLNYFRKKGVFCSENECGLAFIRWDKNRNGKVEWWELTEEIA